MAEIWAKGFRCPSGSTKIRLLLQSCTLEFTDLFSVLLLLELLGATTQCGSQGLLFQDFAVLSPVVVCVCVLAWFFVKKQKMLREVHGGLVPVFGVPCVKILLFNLK